MIRFGRVLCVVSDVSIIIYVVDVPLCVRCVADEYVAQEKIALIEAERQIVCG